MDFIALDFETANSSRSSICSIGLAVVKNGSIQDSKHIYVKPIPNFYDPINISVHGITKNITDKAPTFKELWSSLSGYFANQIMVAHNASFDFSVLRAALDSYKIGYPELAYHCSMRLSKKLLNTENHRLDTVAKHFDINLTHHNAESDAIAAAEIVLKLAKKIRANTLQELSYKSGFRPGRIISKLRTYEPFSNS